MLTITTLLLLSIPPAPSASNASDAALARRAGRDPDAFAELYQRHLPGIYRYHLAHTGNVQDAQDLAAQTFLTALESIGSFRGLGSLAGWLFGIASHKLADHYRRMRPELPLEAAEDLSNQAPHPEEVAVQRLDMARVARALRAVAPERAEALVLRIFGCLSTAEVAQAMNKSEAAVKMLVHRGLSDLQERLAVQREVSL
jgi:RNA polymerase sigma-70 factor, ECF subfamily